MNLHMTRRKFATAAALTPPFALTSVPSLARQMESTPQSATAVMEPTVGITSTLEEWVAAAGEGTPVGEMGTMFEFISPLDGVTPVIVGFTNELATFMEYTYDNAGPGQEDAYAIVAGSIPTESMPGEMFLMPAQDETSSPFTAQVYSTPSSPNTAILSVMALGALEAEEAQVVSISISLPNGEGTDHAATGAPGGVGLTRDEWIAIYGEPSEGGAEIERYAGVGPDRLDLTVSYNMEADAIRQILATAPLETPVTTTFDTAVTFVGGSVPEDSVVGQYFTLPSTQNGPIALDAVLWTSPTLQEQLGYKGSILSMMYLVENEAGREVERIDMTLNSDG